MNTLVPETEPLATQVLVTNDELKVDLADGRRIIVPLAWYPRLMHASVSERRNWELLGGGYAIEWPDLDEHIGVEGLLAGRHGGESQQSLNRWLMARRARAEQRKSGKRPTKRSSRRRGRRTGSH